MGDGRAERSSAVGDAGQAARGNVRRTRELTYVIRQVNACLFESLKVCNLKVRM